MPAGLAEVVAPLAQRGQNVLDGDLEVLAGTRIARIKGLTASLLAAMPPGTFFANLFGSAEPGRPFDAATIAGDGLTYDLHIKNGPFPEIVAQSEQAFPTSVTLVTVSLPVVPVLNDRVILATQHNGANTITTPTGYTLLGHVALADSDVNVYERLLDGTEDTVVDITASVAGAVLVKVWVVRYSNTSLPCELVSQSNTSTGGTSNDLPLLTPSWLIANNLYLTFIGIEADATSPPNITAFPSGFTNTGELQNASATAALDGAIGWGEFPQRSATFDASAYTYTASRSAAFLIAVPPRESGVFNALPGGSAGWDDVLLNDNHSGASNPIVDDLQYMQFGVAAPPASGQIRTNEPFEARGDKNMDVTAGEDINLIAFDGSQFRVTAGALSLRAFDGLTLTSDDSFINAAAFTSMTWTSGTNMTFTPSGFLHMGSITLTDDIAFNAAGIIDINSGTDIISMVGATGINATATAGSISLTAPVVALPTGFLQFTEKAASTPSMIAGNGLFWVKNNTPNDPFFTDDTNADRQIATYPLLFSGFPTIATDTFLGNVSGSTAVPSAINLSTLAGAGLVFGTHTLDVTAGAGASLVVTANDIQRGALTGAITASQDSNTTAFGALAAKSVLANATNASAVPAALAGSAAFQHLRVNSANTGLEWSVFTTGDFPAASVPITALATIATDTFLANVTAGTATPTAVNISTLAGAGLVFGTHTLDVTAGAGGSLIVGANDVQRAALTGAITASQDSNATTFGAITARSVLANATNASAAPTAVQGTTAGHVLQVNAAGTALQWGNPLEVWSPAGASQGFFSTLDLRTGTSIIMSGGAFTNRWQVRPERAALTGVITAAQDDNTTAFASITALSVLANATNASAAPTAVASAADDTVFRRTASTLNWGQLTVGMAPNDVWTYAKIQNVSATSRFLGRITAAAGDIEELTGTQATTLLDTFTSTLKGLAPLSGGGTTNFLRADGTWAAPVAAGDGLGPDGDKGDITVGGTGTTLTIDSGSVTNAKLATMAAKSVKANSTNATAAAADVAGSAAFQHLRVNSGNTGLEWSVFTSGDFPAGVVPLTGVATQAANTIVANATAGTASPTAVTCGAESVFGQTSGNLQGIASAVQTALIRGAGSVFWGAAAADQVLRRSGSGDLGFGTLVTNNIGNNQVTLGLMAQVSTARLLGRTTAATGNVEALTLTNSTTITWNVGTGGAISVERAALTGDVTASANSNATTIATGVVTNAKLATAAANTLKGNITGSTASPTDNTLTATLDALVGTNERNIIARSASGWANTFQVDGIAYLNLPTAGGACVVPWVDQDFDYLVVTTLGASGNTDVFVGITNGAASSWVFTPSSGAFTTTCSSVASAAGHIGVVQLATGTTSGNDAILALVPTLRGDKLSLADFWIKTPIITNVTFRCGLMQSPSATSGGTDSMMFQFDPAVSANYQCITRSASGTATTTTTSSAGSNLFRKFTIWRESSSSIKFYIGNTLVATHTTAIPTGPMLLSSYVKNNTTTPARTMQVDRIRVYADDSTLLT